MSIKDQIEEYIKDNPEGVLKEDIRAYFYHEINETTMNVYISRLLRAKLIRSEKIPNGGNTMYQKARYYPIEQVELSD